VNMNLIELIKTEKSKTTDESYLSYYSGLLENLQSKSLQKVK
jgi:hypothetical protein